MTHSKARTWQVIKAVLGAFAGVQSEKQRQLDFQTSSLVPYIVAGIIAALLFVAALLLTVSLVLA
ncbi:MULTISPECIES: DUF2970 domain-containing protein [unclassified Arsukibacterium]|uniref:DUF2970 domain-containing protein n=1 Tax=unclassified Arsukibacterium TaxID=2635278 RepID=UPI000C4E094C|nr:MULTISPECIES: DUF2970 domain-containing protein [unclassified Arsukibacterium]MAA96008.1 DUF2970 domain-containing protein [Rheinheimera sp.]MBM34303.1 DUF2970 domain-containing protein [Rheinheimera sp.]HAW92309.1 DUF2970 domain-containing protein [Candidatus Azambacteria bacterium]